jgi:ABC-type transport system involved in cytochrome c biogenesis ATPase subunit
MMTFTTDDYMELICDGRETLQIPSDPETEKNLSPLGKDEAIMYLEALGYEHDEEALESQEETTEEEAKHSTGRSDNQVVDLICKDEKRSLLYHGDRSEYATADNDGASEADQALANHITFFSGDQKQTRRILRSSPLGQREKVQNRPDYVKKTVKTAFRGREDFYQKGISHKKQKKPSEGHSEAQEDPFYYTQNGTLEKNETNLIRAFYHYRDLSSRLEFDSFSQEFYLDKEPVEEEALIGLRLQLVDRDSRFSYVTEPLFTRTWIVLAKQENYFHKTADWIRGKRPLRQERTLYPAIPEHDGTPRVEHLLNRICGDPKSEEESEYRREVSLALMKGLVGRILYSGIDFQHMIILEGVSGIGKTTLIRKTLLPEGLAYTTDGEVPSFRDRDFKLQMQKKHILGIEEARMDRKKDQDMIKTAVTATEVEVRGQYQRESQTRGISYVILASTNHKTYLTNQAGSRRYLPVKIYREEGEHMDLQWIIENRPQILAEARDMVEEDMRNHRTLKAEVRSDFVEKMRESVTSTDRVDETIRAFIDNKGWENILREGITWQDVYASDDSFQVAYKPDQKTTRLINNALSEMEEFSDAPKRRRRKDPLNQGAKKSLQVFKVKREKRDLIRDLAQKRRHQKTEAVTLRELRREHHE